MSNKRHRNRRRPRSGVYDLTIIEGPDVVPTPEGFVVFVDDDGERLVYDPGLRDLMRHNCPICRAEGGA